MFDCLKKMGKARRQKLMQFCSDCGIDGRHDLYNEVRGFENIKDETFRLNNKYDRMYNVVVAFKEWEKSHE